MSTGNCTYLKGDAGTVVARPGIEGTRGTSLIEAARELRVLPPKGGGSILGVIKEWNVLPGNTQPKSWAASETIH